MATEQEVEATLDFYRLMGQLAPVAIADQWNAIVHAMETASTVAPGDPSSEQQVALQAYATERSAYEVAVWLQAQLRRRHPDHDDRPAGAGAGAHEHDDDRRRRVDDRTARLTAVQGWAA